MTELEKILQLQEEVTKLKCALTYVRAVTAKDANHLPMANKLLELCREEVSKALELQP